MTNKDFNHWLNTLKPRTRWGMMREAVGIAVFCVLVSWVAMQGVKGLLYVALQIH